jgi:hypothetical protein
MATSRFEANMAITPPGSDDEWAIHSINIHGVFFERWCQHAIAETGVVRSRGVAALLYTASC